MSWQCNYCGHKTQPAKEVEPNEIDYPAGRACYECGKGEMVYRPINPKPLMVSFIVQSSNDGRVWEDYFVGDSYSSESEAIGVAIEQHERYHFTNNYRVISRAEKVLWEGKKHD